MRRKMERSEVVFLLMMVPWYTSLALYTTDDVMYFLLFLPFWILPLIMWYAKCRRSESGEAQDERTHTDQSPPTPSPGP
jgi:hypothetical protein